MVARFLFYINLFYFIINNTAVLLKPKGLNFGDVFRVLNAKNAENGRNLKNVKKNGKKVLRKKNI